LTQRLNSFLSSSQELRQLSGKAKQLRVLQQHYAKIAPPSLLNFSQVLHIEQNILTLAANNGAVASKLRQMVPEFIRQLQLQGCEVTGIQVRVQVTAPITTRVALPATLSAEGKQQLSKLTATLADSPLKSALRRLLQSKPKNK